ncbi:hypothetical protein HAX54_040969, partial [Datura stramonium]|nr:hypothetical protein [Datura stramonium]
CSRRIVVSRIDEGDEASILPLLRSPTASSSNPPRNENYGMSTGLPRGVLVMGESSTWGSDQRSNCPQIPFEFAIAALDGWLLSCCAVSGQPSQCASDCSHLYLNPLQRAHRPGSASPTILIAKGLPLFLALPRPPSHQGMEGTSQAIMTSRPPSAPWLICKEEY